MRTAAVRGVSRMLLQSPGEATCNHVRADELPIENVPHVNSVYWLLVESSKRNLCLSRSRGLATLFLYCGAWP